MSMMGLIQLAVLLVASEGTVDLKSNVCVTKPVINEDKSVSFISTGSCEGKADIAASLLAQLEANVAKAKEEENPHIDLLFVLDGSASIGVDNFEVVKKWVKAVVKNLNINLGNVSVGVVQYSHWYPSRPISDQPHLTTHVAIGQHKTFETFAAEVNKIKLQGFTTHTGHALQKVLLDFNSTINFGKPNNKQVMVLVTDGASTDGSTVPKSAQELRDIGVIPFAIGVGNATDISELRLIANGNATSDARVLVAGDFDELTFIENVLLNDLLDIMKK